MATVGLPSRLSGARSLSEPSGRFWEGLSRSAADDLLAASLGYLAGYKSDNFGAIPIDGSRVIPAADDVRNPPRDRPAIRSTICNHTPCVPRRAPVGSVATSPHDCYKGKPSRPIGYQQRQRRMGKPSVIANHANRSCFELTV
jgi:hypothetical protein